MKETRKDLPRGANQEEIMDMLVNACGHNIMATITELYGPNAIGRSEVTPQAIHVAVTAANAAVQVIAALVTSSDSQISHERWNDGAVAFACQLIAAATSLNKSGPEQQLSAAAGPDILAKALRNTETVLGRNIDADLNPSLVEAARDETAIAFAAMQRQTRAASEHSGHRLH